MAPKGKLLQATAKRFTYNMSFLGLASENTGGNGFQMILSGPDVNYEDLKAQKGNVKAVHDEFRRVTGRTDLTISDVTNWQGEWRYVIFAAKSYLG